MPRWQRHLRIALGLFVIVFAAVVYFAMRRTPPPARPSVSRPIDPKAQSEVSRGRIWQYKGKDLDFTLDYEKVIEYAGGTKSLRTVHATFVGRSGQQFEMWGDEASVSTDQTGFTIRGNVRMKSGNLTVNSQEASYSQAEGAMRVPGPLDFTRGSMRGTAVGLIYDDKTDLLSLLDQVSIVGDEAAGQPPSTIHAGSAVWDRPQKIMQFQDNVKILRRGQTIESDIAIMFFTPDEEHLEALELDGNARITGSPTVRTAAPAAAVAAGAGRRAEGGSAAVRPTSGLDDARSRDAKSDKPHSQEPKAQRRLGAGPEATAPASGTLRSMRAADITLTYAEDGETVQQAVLTNDASVEVESADSKGVTRIAGHFIDIGLDPDGSTMSSLVARAADPRAQPAELSLPAQPDAPARVIRAVTIQGPVPGKAVEPGKGLTSLRFIDNVDYREMPAPPAVPRRATSRLLDTVVQPGFGTVDEARFSGGVTFREGDTLQATSRDALYTIKAGQLDLTGSDDKGNLPQVVDEQATIQAQHIKLTPDGRGVWAQDKVQANFKSNQKRPDGKAVHTPGILTGDQPVYATADHLDYDGSKSLAIFTSKAKSRLWQPDRGTAIYAIEIQVDNDTGNLRGKGSVVTTMMLDQVDDKTKEKKKVASEARGEQMFYEDATHRATYTTRAHVKAPEGDLTSDRAVLYLTEDGSALERLEAFTKVELHTQGPEDTGMRIATGDKLVYTASDERYVMTGRTVNYRDDCSETQGKSLTFFRSAGRIVVDGNEERRTQSKGTQGCKK